MDAVRSNFVLFLAIQLIWNPEPWVTFLVSIASWERFVLSYREYVRFREQCLRSAFWFLKKIMSLTEFVSGLAPEKNIFPVMDSTTGNNPFDAWAPTAHARKYCFPVPNRKQSLASSLPILVSGFCNIRDFNGASLKKARRGIEPRIFGLLDRRLTAWPPSHLYIKYVIGFAGLEFRQCVFKRNRRN